MKKPLIAVTMGDPGGIGPEITLEAVRTLRGRARFLLVGKPEIFSRASRAIGKHIPFPVIQNISELNKRNNLTLLDLPNSSGRFHPGKLSKINGQLAYLSLRKGAELALKGVVSALVTAPLSKAAVRLSHKRFEDQTEFLRSFTGAKRYAMSFIKGRSCVTLVTTHVPIKNISARLKRKDIVEKAILTAEFLTRTRNIRHPRLAVLGLNPHAGEGGFLGREEEYIIGPAIRDLRKRGIRAVGPLPADSAFYLWKDGQFDAAIAMYHDQGLAPFKMLYFHDGVHITLGLPFIRTSPDHGTAFDLAYRGKANANAMREALLAAIRFASLR